MEDRYKKLGFKCGLEIHQRLATAEKLFCSCSADTPNDSNIGRVTRRQRAVAGELGAVDRSTSFESSRERSFVYNLFKDTSCLVDIDEEPPHAVNREAVEIALRFASAFGAKVPDEIEPMRKEVVDGSDPCAFQRTMMVAYDGAVPIKGRKVRMTSLFLEEESSGIESTGSDSVVYNIDRIGIPLVEIDTDPSITSPQEAKEVALRIGQMLRLTGAKKGEEIVSGVQRGIGTIRQDVNVSIAEGTRVEIKGLQEIEAVDLLIENEVERQVRLIAIRKELAEKGLKQAGKEKPKDLTKTFGKECGRIIKDTLERGGVVLGARLEGFAGVLGMEINPDRRIGSEISDYARMAGVKGLMHSDEDLGKYGISEADEKAIRKELGAAAGDAFILIAADRESCSKAMSFALDRARMVLSEVPPETRAILDSKKGTTRFLRPLPGGSRMYPETDAAPIEVSREMYEGIKKNTVYVEDRLERIKKGLNNAQIAEQLASSPRLPLYEYITSRVKGVNLIVATTLLEKLKELTRAGVEVELDRDAMAETFRLYAEGSITKAAIGEIIGRSPKSAADVSGIIKRNSLGRISGSKLRELVAKAKAEGKGDIVREIMSRYRLNVDGEELNALLKGKK